MEVAAQIGLHLQVEMYHLENKKKRWISPTPFNRFSSSFHQIDRTVAGRLILVTDELESVGQCQN